MESRSEEDGSLHLEKLTAHDVIAKLADIRRFYNGLPNNHSQEDIYRELKAADDYLRNRLCPPDAPPALINARFFEGALVWQWLGGGRSTGPNIPNVVEGVFRSLDGLGRAILVRTIDGPTYIVSPWYPGSSELQVDLQVIYPEPTLE